MRSSLRNGPRPHVLGLTLAIVAVAGCSGDDTQGLLPDAGAVPDAASNDATLPGPQDAGPLADADASIPPILDGGADSPVDAPIEASATEFLLVSYAYGADGGTQYSAFSVPAGAVVGGLRYPQYGINVATSTSPWVLEQAANRVLRMDPQMPWAPTSSWNVTEPPPSPAYSSTDAIAVAEVGTKAYVAGYASDFIAVLDTSHPSDGGAPIKSISLAPFVADADVDHDLEAVALAYDATQKRVWVVLGNSDDGAASGGGTVAPCSAGFHPLVVAIDTTTDTIVPGVQYSLSGYGVRMPSEVAYDAKNERFFVASQGCAIKGGTIESYVEELSLTVAADAGADTILFDPAPSSTTALVYVDEHHAYVQSAGGTNAWDPTLPALGELLPNAPDVFQVDTAGHLLGPRTTSLSDGGYSIAVVSLDPLDGGVTTLATDPFSPVPLRGAWRSIATWPHP